MASRLCVSAGIAGGDLLEGHSVTRPTVWYARLAVASVFVVNVQCATAFIFMPERFTARFELSGPGAAVAVQALGILFLMWNATYPLVVLDPVEHLVLFAVVLAQQTIGIVGESWLWATLPASADVLADSIARFIAFDVAVLLLMTGAYLLLRRGVNASRRG